MGKKNKSVLDGEPIGLGSERIRRCCVCGCKLRSGNKRSICSPCEENSWRTKS